MTRDPFSDTFVYKNQNYLMGDWMEGEREDPRRRIESMAEGIRRAGVRLTHQRLEVLREVAGSGDHPDAETVYSGVRERVPTISLDTVYRTLWMLTDLGLITTLAVPWERVRFDGNTTPHHHFVCMACGMTRDFHSEELDQLRIPDSVRGWGSVERARVEVRGVCLRCTQESSPRHRLS